MTSFDLHDSLSFAAWQRSTSQTGEKHKAKTSEVLLQKQGEHWSDLESNSY